MGGIHSGVEGEGYAGGGSLGGAAGGVDGNGDDGRVLLAGGVGSWVKVPNPILRRAAFCIANVGGRRIAANPALGLSKKVLSSKFKQP